MQAAPPPRKPHPLEQGPRPAPAEGDATAAPRVSLPVVMPARPAHPYLTYGLIAINVLIFLVGFLSTEWRDGLWAAGMLYPPAVVEGGEVYRLFTAMFLHANAQHVLFNMLALYVIGTSVEFLFGPTRFAIIYFLGGLTGSVASLYLGEYAVASLGASGAVFAIWGAQGVHLMTHRAFYGPALRRQLQSFLIVLVLNLFITFTAASIDTWGHVGGLAGGVVLALLTGPRLTRHIDMIQRQVVIEDAGPGDRQIAVVALGYGALLLLAVFIRLAMGAP
jgi:rhomboid protease GluP